jgi:hypothetical protein
MYKNKKENIPVITSKENTGNKIKLRIYYKTKRIKFYEINHFISTHKLPVKHKMNNISYKTMLFSLSNPFKPATTYNHINQKREHKIRRLILESLFGIDYQFPFTVKN